jgi:hypothetical protein
MMLDWSLYLKQLPHPLRINWANVTSAISPAPMPAGVKHRQT